MTVQAGKDLLIKIDLNGSGQYETVAGLRATRLNFNAQTIDITNANSDGWRELLAGAGIKSASISGSGVFSDAASDARARQIFFEGDLPNFQIIIPDFGIVEGAFQITSLEYAGSYDGEATFDMSLSSAGRLTFSEI